MEGVSDILKQQPLPTDLNYLVIGGNGFFGYKLVEALVAKGLRKVRVFDLRQTRFQGVEEVDFHVGNICNYEQVASAITGIDVIFHTASCFGNPAFGSFGEGAAEWEVNVEGTRKVLQAARQEAKRTGRLIRLIYIGSTSAVFTGERDFFNETEESGRPLVHVDHYGRSKHVAEQEVQAANNEKVGLLTCVLRPNGIYGENEPIHFPRVRSLCSLMGDHLLFHFEGKMDWTFVENLAFACFLAVLKLQPGSRVNGNAYNITDGEAVDVIEFFRPALESTGVSVRPIVILPFFLVYFFTYIIELFCFVTFPVLGLKAPFTRIETIKTCRSHSFSYEKAKAHLGYVPLISTEEGKRRTAKHFAKQFYLAHPERALPAKKEN